MIILNLKADNLMAFQNFDLNFSYPKKIVNSTIPEEYFITKPNFRYKKLLILIGTNASGKTSIGKLLVAIVNFIRKKESNKILRHIKDNSKEASFEMDFALDEEKLYRVKCLVKNKKIEKKEEKEIELEVFETKIGTNDSYEKCCKKLKPIILEGDSSANNSSNSYISKLEKIPQFGWLFSFPGDADSSCSIIKDDKGVLEIDILEKVLETLDPSITKVEKSNEVENSYIIRSTNGDVFVQNGEIKENNLLSSGTKAGIDIAYIISSMKKNDHGFYYCDERFSYIQSDIEMAILGLMMELIPRNSQLIFTTHNLDILEMNLPVHTFLFLRKERDIITPVYPKAFKETRKNDISLRNLVKNDLFSIIPRVEKIHEIGEK